MTLETRIDNSLNYIIRKMAAMGINRKKPHVKKGLNTVELEEIADWLNNFEKTLIQEYNDLLGQRQQSYLDNLIERFGTEFEEVQIFMYIKKRVRFTWAEKPKGLIV